MKILNMYTFKDLENILGISKYTIRRLIKEGVFPDSNRAIKRPRLWNKQIVEDWIKENEIYIVDFEDIKN